MSEFSIDADDLSGEFERSPALFARRSQEAVEAFNHFHRLKLTFEAEESRLRMLLREEMAAESLAEFNHLRAQCKTATERGSIRLQKPSTDEITDRLRSLPVYCQLREELLVAEVAMKQAKALADAARFKKDMLTNLGHLTGAQMRHLTPPRLSNGFMEEFAAKSR